LNKETNRAGRPKSAEKRKQVLEAASDLFLEFGFSGCSMEMVAKQSGVSKQTVYSHFSNKEALFLAVIEDKCAEYQLDDRNLEGSNYDLIQVLRERGLQLVKILHDDKVISMYRVIIGEVNSNPRVAELFYQAGPKHSLDYLAKCFLKCAEQPFTEELAYKYARVYFSLLKSEFHTKSILGLDFALSDSEQISQVEFAIQQVESLLACKVS
jgi:TetR/AcrR family transcriptional repressor of mexJK operon